MDSHSCAENLVDIHDRAMHLVYRHCRNRTLVDSQDCALPLVDSHNGFWTLLDNIRKTLGHSKHSKTLVDRNFTHCLCGQCALTLVDSNNPQ